MRWVIRTERSWRTFTRHATRLCAAAPIELIIESADVRISAWSVYGPSGWKLNISQPIPKQRITSVRWQKKYYEKLLRLIMIMRIILVLHIVMHCTLFNAGSVVSSRHKRETDPSDQETPNSEEVNTWECIVFFVKIFREDDLLVPP